jgi:phage baseplate assembly protein W
MGIRSARAAVQVCDPQPDSEALMSAADDVRVARERLLETVGDLHTSSRDIVAALERLIDAKIKAALAQPLAPETRAEIRSGAPLGWHGR